MTAWVDWPSGNSVKCQRGQPPDHLFNVGRSVFFLICVNKLFLQARTGFNCLHDFTMVIIILIIINVKHLAQIATAGLAPKWADRPTPFSYCCDVCPTSHAPLISCSLRVLSIGRQNQAHHHELIVSKGYNGSY